jgi:hypothetical protein
MKNQIPGSTASARRPHIVSTVGQAASPKRTPYTVPTITSWITTTGISRRICLTPSGRRRIAPIRPTANNGSAATGSVNAANTSNGVASSRS